MLWRFARAWVWMRMVRVSARGDFAKALLMVRENQHLAHGWLPWRVFELQQLGLLKNYVGEMMHARELIADLKSRMTLTSDEQYFLAFAQWYGCVGYRRLHNSATECPEEFRFDVTFPLSSVSGFVKRIFPMPIHPEWANNPFRLSAAQ